MLDFFVNSHLFFRMGCSSTQTLRDCSFCFWYWCNGWCQVTTCFYYQCISRITCTLLHLSLPFFIIFEMNVRFFSPRRAILYHCIQTLLVIVRIPSLDTFSVTVYLLQPGKSAWSTELGKNGVWSLIFSGSDCPVTGTLPILPDLLLPRLQNLECKGRKILSY